MPRSEHHAESSSERYALGLKNSHNLDSGDPVSGRQSYSQRAKGGIDIRMDSVRPRDCKPNKVPRS